MGRMTPLVFLFLVFLFVTYNVITIFVGFEKSKSRDVGFPDPIIQNPTKLGNISEKLLFHIALTATDTSYSKWQCRIMYYRYMKNKNLPGSEMGKFTWNPPFRKP